MDVIISVAADHDSKEVVAALAKNGLQVERSMFKGRIIAGSCDAVMIPALQQVPGVKSLEVGQEVRAQEG